jgi:predicted deacylase
MKIIITLCLILGVLSAQSQIIELDSIQKRHLTKSEEIKKYHEYSVMVGQIPMLDVSNFSIGETRAGYSVFLKTLDNISCHKEVIGNVRGYDIMGLTIGDVKKKPVILLHNQHGNEYHGVHTLREFARLLTTSQDSRIKYLRKKFAFYIIPTVAAWNYDNNKYLLPNGVNLNRQWDRGWERSKDKTKGSAPWSEKEVVIVRDKILELKPFLHIDIHHSSKPGLDITSPGWKPLLMAVHDSLKDFPNSPTQYWRIGNDQPTATGWGQLQTAKDGKPSIATALETDGKEPETALKYGLNILYRLCYMTAKLR